MIASCKQRFITMTCLTLCSLFLLFANLVSADIARHPVVPAQKSFPAVPGDLTRVYYMETHPRRQLMPGEYAHYSRINQAWISAEVPRLSLGRESAQWHS